MNRAIVPLSLALTLAVTTSSAGPEKVAFPPYQTHLLYAVVERPDIKEVREVYATPETARLVRAGQALPSGSVLTLVHFKARVDAAGALTRDPSGRLVRGDLDRIGVMEKRAGWGVEYPESLRNGEWEYALFGPDGARNEKANIKGCFECHKPKAAQDFVFTLERFAPPPR